MRQRAGSMSMKTVRLPKLTVIIWAFWFATIPPYIYVFGVRDARDRTLVLTDESRKLGTQLSKIFGIS
jgi:hypothetical protein